MASSQPRTVGPFQHIFAALATLVFLGVNFGLNSGIENVATKSSVLNTPIQMTILAVLIYQGVRRRTDQRPALRHLAPFLLLLGLAACSSLWSQSPDASLRRSASLMSLMMFALYAHTVLGTVATCRMQVAATWIAAAASLAAAVIVPRSGFDLGEYAGAIRGVFTQKNSLGDAMVAGVTALMFLVLRRQRVLWTDIATVLMAGCMIRLSQSTTALLLYGLVLTATVGALLWMRGTAWSLYALLMLAGTALCVAWIVAMEPSLFYHTLGKNETLTGRAQIWRAVLNASGGLPVLGYGYSAFWLPDSHAVGDIWYELGWETPSAHSGYLDTAMQIGIVGLAVLAWLAVLTVVRAARAFGTDRRTAAFWALTQLLVIAIFNYDESSLPQPDIHLLQWILAFLACSAIPAGRTSVDLRNLPGAAEWRFSPPATHPAAYRKR